MIISVRSSNNNITKRVKDESE
jgi:DNA-binding NarL/FixJ family response regulator